MRKLKKSSPQTIQDNPIQDRTVSKKITFRCDTFLLEKIKNTLASQQLAGNYQYPNLSAFIRAALQAYQEKMPLAYQRENNPKKEISFRLAGGLLIFYESLLEQTKSLILERALGSYYYQCFA